MRFLTPKKAFFYAVTLCLTSNYINAQDQNITVNQDSKFEQLLNEKRKTNISNTVNDRYKVQIFSGDSEKAKNTLNEFKQEFVDMDGTIVFNTPNYKVWVGNFKTRIEAEHNLIDIRKKYKNVLLIKPSK
ncbi:SPOR domain-containing protein [Flavobacterium sp. AED]|uniref:SPOR domain-containing protein n=1 Tax=Flavobacterium sp. AED TaxID=1423323 RepID=UPI0005807888|nr:SPOR domain-containing protein [Flavobacterium sp. AED]KIA87296.1 sporulation protein [Flavobacterium sp. AED]MDI1305642.1 SPOR domain-containing protein [bacterium]